MQQVQVLEQSKRMAAAELAEGRAPFVMALQAEQPAEALAAIRKIQASVDAMTARARDAQTTLSATYRRSMDNARAASQYHRAARF